MEGVQAYVTFRFLGGPVVSHEQVTSEIAQWPLDGILGFLGALSLEAVQAGQEFSDPRRQGDYLNQAIVDDFPVVLPGASMMYAPGRVPFTGGRHLLVHERNLAWLTHEALLSAREGIVTPELNYAIRSRLCRLLLITNDFFAETDSPPVPSRLTERHNFVLTWLRHGQFNKFFEPCGVTIHKIARQYTLMLELLPKYFHDTEAAFCEATNGVSLQKYFEILVLFVAHIHYEMSPAEKRWLSRETLCAAVRAHRDDLERIVRRWIRTPEEYRQAWDEWRRCRPAPDYQPYYDFVPLRETPLIEARPGDLICPVIPFLFAKIVDEPYFILSDHLKKTSQKLQDDFRQALGYAYQEYAHRLVERIGRTDRSGRWQVRDNPKTRKDGELSDSYLQRGNIGITFEHKGQRPGTDFLRGGQGELVLGPSHSVLTRLEQQETVTFKKPKKQDKGLFTQGMWQQSRVSQALLNWAECEMGTRPTRVFPLITYLANLHVDELTRVAYLNPLMVHAKMYHDSFWERPQWLHISDLEALAALADQGTLDLATLLHEKVTRWENKQFDIFLYEHLGYLPFDLTLHDKGEALLKSAGVSFWLEELPDG
jgi:hypothetical protein